jgi:hypothetical protein
MQPFSRRFREYYGDVSVLGLIVLIRTFLSFSLEVEINGRWPWQPDAKPKQERNLTDSEGQAVL